MKRVLVDSGAFFGLLVPEDEFHDMAQGVMSRARAERWRLVTTNAIVSEAYTLLRTRARSGRNAALALLDSLDAGLCVIERVSAEDEHRAVDLLRRHADKDFSFCDALSFVVMERLSIKEAMAFDRHFREYGRITVL